MEQINNQVKKILKTLLVNGNGESADVINKYNKNSNLPSFGIIYPQLKTFAQKYEPNNKVAMVLIHKNTRDARIMGIILSNIKSITIDEALRMAIMLNTEELKNIFASHILSQLPYLTQLPLTYAELFGINLTMKAIVQHFRKYKASPTFENCKPLLNEILKEKQVSKTDIKNFIELVYKSSVSNRTEWIRFLTNTSNTNKELKQLIDDAIYDFKYID